MKIANRLSEIAPFRVMELLARANELAEDGHDVIHLEVGEPDFETPGPIVSAGIQALQNGVTRYSDARGTPALRQQISSFYELSLGVSVSLDRIFVTAGASGGLLLLCALLMNPGENLLMTDPGYPCNRHFLASFNAQGILVPVTAAENYQLTPELIDTYWNTQSRGVLVASPANPTGSVLGRDDIGALSAKVLSLGGFLMVDEIYQGLVYENPVSTNDRATSVLQIEPEAIVINSFSKYFGMTGWRLGWIVVPPALTVPLEKLAQNLFICPSAIAQEAALAAFSTESITIMEAQKAEFSRRRNFLVPALQGLGFDIPLMPAGAFYVYAGLPENIEDAESFCKKLLEDEYVAITPGTDFGFHRADRFVRISYARELAQLEEAVRRLRRALR